MGVLIKVMKELRRLTLLSFILAIYTVEANKEITNSSTIKEIGSNEKSGCNCGLPTSSSRIIGGQERIIGGQDTETNEYPWMVQLVYKSFWSGNNHLCGGTLVSSRHVLTAAHCVIRYSPQSIAVILGEHNIKDQEFYTVELIDILNHPQYDEFNGQYDFSILTLAEKVIFSNTVSPACLPSDPSEQYAGQKGVIAGWGATEFGSPTFLQKLDVSIWSNDQCIQELGEYFISDPNICITGKSACYGDSGGPLTVLEKGRNVLVGICNWGWACMDENPSVYARITDQLDWIKMNTNGVMDSNCNLLS